MTTAITHDWLVEVYQNGYVCGSWRIENRTESEAEQEAVADIEREFPDSDDYTLIKIPR